MTESEGLPAAGWQDDPEDATQLRYWDGSAWTEHRSPKAGVAQAAKAQPPPTTGPPPGMAAPPKQGAPWWLAAVIAVVTLVLGLIIGIGIGAAFSGDDDPVAAPATSRDEAPETGTPADPATDDDGDGDEPAPNTGGGSGTATDPLAIDTPWTYDMSWFGDEDGTMWEGEFEGLVTLPVDEWDEDANARCYAIIGTMAPTQIADGAFTNDFFDTPSFEVVVGGAAQTAYGYCDYDELVAAGYGDVLDAEVSVGTQYKFYQEVYLPSTVTGDIDLIVLGSASETSALFYLPTPAAVG